MAAALSLLGLALLVAGGWLYFQAQRRRHSTGLPGGEIIYVDTGDWHRNERPLFSARYRLSGKPDYLVAQGESIIPVEVKSTRLRGAEPYDSHKLQLAAYCLLVEEDTGRRPPYGILHYADASVRLPYSGSLRAELLDTLKLMRAGLDARSLDRSHDEHLRCERCGFHHACGSQALV